MSSEAELEQLSATIGIDLSKLKEKYMGSAKPVGQAISYALSAEERVAQQKKLDSLVVCQSCQDSGLIRVVYNFMSLERNCSECGGEGVSQKLEARVEEIKRTLATEADAEVATSTVATVASESDYPST